jgi:hypothetical protein
VAAALLVAAVVIAGYFTFARRPLPPPPTTTQARPPATGEPSPPLGGEAQAIAIPPLAESDPVVRMLVRMLSDHPVVTAYLATNDLIVNFAAAVSNIAEDVSPAKQLQVLRPREGFRATTGGGKVYIDARSYGRYNRIAEAVDSIDPAGAAKLYATLKPRIEEAAGELGLPAGQFDRVLEKAIVLLLRTPVSDQPIQVVPNIEGIGYGFVDSRLEGLSIGQKALIRMGPANARSVKARLRQIALALGIPVSHLPAE